jgi:hypothetical protein
VKTDGFGLVLGFLAEGRVKWNFMVSVTGGQFLLFQFVLGSDSSCSWLYAVVMQFSCINIAVTSVCSVPDYCNAQQHSFGHARLTKTGWQ